MAGCLYERGRHLKSRLRRNHSDSLTLLSPYSLAHPCSPKKKKAIAICRSPSIKLTKSLVSKLLKCEPCLLKIWVGKVYFLYTLVVASRNRGETMLNLSMQVSQECFFGLFCRNSRRDLVGWNGWLDWDRTDLGSNAINGKG